MAETELERAKRHVADGAARVKRQRALAHELRASGQHETLAAEAERLLGEFLAIQAQHETHLDKLLRRDQPER